jgi:hypothetical protein
MFRDLTDALSQEDIERVESLGLLDDACAFTEDVTLDDALANSVVDSYQHEQTLAQEFAEFYFQPTPKVEGRLARRLKMRAAQKWER